MQNMRTAEYVDLLLQADHELEVTCQAMADSGDEADIETRMNFAKTLKEIGENISEIAFFLQKDAREVAAPPPTS